MNSSNRLAVGAIFLSCVFFLLQYMSIQPPTPKGLDAPANEFSAARAYVLLETLLAENRPHPVGSPLNKLVKSRLKTELTRLNIEFTEQKTWACATRFASCANVENVIATIPGSSELPYLALMAHYDSVPMAPGAGDDGAGVVALLEAARVLKREGPLLHPIMLIFTDAEEVGLVGAEAFFQQHPLNDQVGIVLNVEGSGSSGGSMVIRTSNNNALMLKSYTEDHQDPYGFSFVKEIFKRMPNDTDFSVVARAGIAGMDFAFAGERNHYHTPNDNLENIDLRTIQHHGDNILPLARRLASVAWDDMGGEVVYAGEIYGTWLQWDASYSTLLWLAAAVLFGVAILKLEVPGRDIIKGAILSTLTLLLVILTGGVSFYLLLLTAGKIISWPGIEWPYRLLLASSTLIGLLAGTLISRRFVSSLGLFLGGWLLWLCMAAAVLHYLPAASNTFLVPLLWAGATTIVACWVKPTWRMNFLMLVLIMTIPSTLGLLFPLEQSQGYKLVWALLPFIALFAITLAPFLFGLNQRVAMVSALLGVTLSLIYAATNTLYTEYRPQQVNIAFYEDLDQDKAFIELAGNGRAMLAEPLIEPLASYVAGREPASLVPFNADVMSDQWAPTDTSGWSGPSAHILATPPDRSRRVLRLRSERGASRLVVLLPEASLLETFSFGTREFDATLSTRGLFKGYYPIYINGMYDQTVELTLKFSEPKANMTGYVMDISTKLPASADALVLDRTGIFAPVHRGDQAFLIKQFVF